MSVQPSTSEEPVVIFTQSSTICSIDAPSTSDKITSPRQAALASPSISKTTNTPLPAGMVTPVKLNPKTVVALLESIKPASSAAPPEAPVTVTPVTLN